ncbi:DUF4097 family beta strand repeat-containing protein [Candidatus Bipolaricaulota sp. J31]
MGVVRGEFVREIPVDEPVELVVTAGSGDVEVQGGTTGKVVVRGTFSVHAVPASRAERLAELLREHPPVEVRGHEVRVGNLSRLAEEIGPSLFGRMFEGIGIDYGIEVPQATEARIETGAGDIEVKGIRGPLVVHTGSGDVEIEEVCGEVSVKTGSGDVEARGIGGELRVRTGSGDVAVHGAKGDVEITTGSGDLEAGEISGDLSLTTGSGDLTLEGIEGDVEARTGSGDIRLESDISPGRTWRLRTGSGDVHLALPEGAEFRLIAETDFGEVRSDFPERSDVPSAIEVKTGSGDIEVRSRERRR